MSEEQLKAFLEKVKGDTSLQDRLKAAKSAGDVVSIGEEHGHEFGTEHISRLSEKELEGVSGGTTMTIVTPVIAATNALKAAGRNCSPSALIK